MADRRTRHPKAHALSPEARLRLEQIVRAVIAEIQSQIERYDALMANRDDVRDLPEKAAQARREARRAFTRLRAIGVEYCLPVPVLAFTDPDFPGRPGEGTVLIVEQEEHKSWTVAEFLEHLTRAEEVLDKWVSAVALSALEAPNHSLLCYRVARHMGVTLEDMAGELIRQSVSLSAAERSALNLPAEPLEAPNLAEQLVERWKQAGKREKRRQRQGTATP